MMCIYTVKNLVSFKKHYNKLRNIDDILQSDDVYIIYADKELI